MKTEIWKDIVGYEGKYQVSNLGHIKSMKYHRGNTIKILSNIIDYQGYSLISINNGKVKTFLIHRLVALHFIPNPLNLPCVLHKDETLDKNGALYNGEDNLWWGTKKDNAQDREKKGRGKGYLPGKYNVLSKCVSQYTLNGKFIKKWESMNFAGKCLGIAGQSISSCCLLKRKSAGGFVWKH